MKVKLGEICDISSAKRVFEKEYVAKGVPFIRGLEISNGSILNENTLFECYISEERYQELKMLYGVPQKGDILITAVGTIGNLCYIDSNREFYFKDGNIIWLKNFQKDIYSQYLYYFMKSPFFKNQLEHAMIGAVQKALTMIMLEKIEIELPSYEMQISIASILSCIDLKIKNNIQINMELESMAKTIYDYWFLQFEFPNEDGKPYKSSGGKMVWNEEMKREIPEGWKAGRLNQLIKQDKGGDWGKELPEGNYLKKVTCLRGSDIPSICGPAKLEAPERFINEKNTFKILKEGDLIIEISGGSPTQSTGRICYINTNVLKRFENEIITSNFCKAINLIDKDFMYWFYILWCKLYDSGVLYKYEGKTTGIKNLLFEMFCRDYPIIIPNTNVIKKYNNKMENLFDVIQKNLLENAELSSLRDFLLPLLMNGQVGFKS